MHYRGVSRVLILLLDTLAKRRKRHIRSEESQARRLEKYQNKLEENKVTIEKVVEDHTRTFRISLSDQFCILIRLFRLPYPYA